MIRDLEDDCPTHRPMQLLGFDGQVPTSMSSVLRGQLHGKDSSTVLISSVASQVEARAIEVQAISNLLRARL